MSEAFRLKNQARQSADWMLDDDGTPMGLIGPDGKLYKVISVGESELTGEAEYSALPGIDRDASIVTFGDSLTAANTTTSATTFGTYDTGWLTWANSFAGDSQVLLVHNAGISGNTTTQMLARIDTDVLAHDAGYVSVWGGINDLFNDLEPAATVIDNLNRIYSILLFEGRAIIAHTLTARATHPNYAAAAPEMALVNDWIRGQAAVGRVILFDVDKVARGGTLSGSLEAEDFQDNVHFNPRGARKLGIEGAALLKRLVRSGRRVRPANLLTNGMFFDHNDVIATGFTSHTSGSATVSTFIDPDPYIGNRQIINAGFSASTDFSYIRGPNVSGSLSIGDRIYAECEIEVLSNINMRGVQLHLAGTYGGSTMNIVSHFRHLTSLGAHQPGDKLLMRTPVYEISATSTLARPEILLFAQDAGAGSVAVSKLRLSKV